MEVVVSPSAHAQGEALDRNWFVARLAEAIDLIDAAPRVVRVSIVGDEEMTRLHVVHLGIPTTTDVLTFVDEAPVPLAEADIAVCIDEAARQSSIRGITLERELLLYAIHGVLHGAGFDDRNPDSFARMHAEEDRILGLMGIPPTFGAGEGDA